MPKLNLIIQPDFIINDSEKKVNKSLHKLSLDENKYSLNNLMDNFNKDNDLP